MANLHWFRELAAYITEYLESLIPDIGTTQLWPEKQIKDHTQIYFITSANVNRTTFAKSSGATST